MVFGGFGGSFVFSEVLVKFVDRVFKQCGLSAI